MISSKQVVQGAINSVDPYDALEHDHKQDVLDWIDSDLPLFRISKPDNPPKHLVSYFVLFDESSQSIMLIDHIKAGLWLPPGGHVEVDESPYDAVIREASEELQTEADFNTPFGVQPFFITVTETRNADVHTDVSLWYVIKGSVGVNLNFDTSEMKGIRWLTLDEVFAIDIKELDPHMHRFTKKMKNFLSSSKVKS